MTPQTTPPSPAPDREALRETLFDTPMVEWNAAQWTMVRDFARAALSEAAPPSGLCRCGRYPTPGTCFDIDNEWWHGHGPVHDTRAAPPSGALDFAPPLPELDCGCSACRYLRRKQAEYRATLSTSEPTETT